MSNRTELSRRTILKVIGGVGAGLSLGCYAPKAAEAEAKTESTGPEFAPNAFVRIEGNGDVIVTASRSDMGQGVRTTLAMILAEELDADWTRVHVIQAGGDQKKYGSQGTGGSSSVRSTYGQFRQMGAAARQMLVAAAAKQWGVEPSSCRTEKGRVLHDGTKKSASYGELTQAAAAMPVPSDNIQLKDKSKFTIIGKPTRRVDNAAVVTGKAMYGIDSKVDNMVFAVIARRLSFGASLQNVDDADARKIPGVVDVVRVGSGVAVLATNTWVAMKGREALKLTWDAGPNADLSSRTISDKLREAVGDLPALPDGAKLVEATYDFPYLAHATMEPMNAVADVRDDSCVVWAATQTPDGAQSQVARQLGISQDKVTINLTLLGGGFGRRLSNDYIAEAVEISKAAKRPVKLLWTREDDMRNDNYRPASHHAMRGGLDAQGKPVAWSHRAVQAGGRGGGSFGNAGIPYEIPNAGMSRGGAPIPIPTGAWRSVENTQLTPANECFIDEMAVAAGKDPFEFRRGLLRDGRLKAVLELAAQKADWGKPLPKGVGRGIACFGGYGSYVAHVVELSVENGEIKLHRVVIALDCGLAINPMGVEAQAQGACVDALSTALFAAITIRKGTTAQDNFDQYKWMRMDRMPHIEFHRIESDNEPGGMGEVGYPSVMPAVANALFQVTGKRVRAFPIILEEA